MSGETFRVRDAMGREKWIERDIDDDEMDQLFMAANLIDPDLELLSDYEIDVLFRGENPEPVNPEAMDNLRETLRRTANTEAA